MTATTDTTTRILTKEECLKEIKLAEKNLAIYQEEKAPEPKMLRIKMEIAVWDRLLEHLQNGEIVTINSKKEIQWHKDCSHA